jgi:hypothetical protein
MWIAPCWICWKTKSAERRGLLMTTPNDGEMIIGNENDTIMAAQDRARRRQPAASVLGARHRRYPHRDRRLGNDP